MAAELVTPTCEVTNLPLLIYPTEPQKGALFLPENYHHLEHPNTDQELQGLEGRALRYSAGQDVSRTLHDNYHRLFLGPKLPTTTEEKFRSTVLQCAGVIPRQALDVSQRGTYKVVTLTDKEMLWMSDPRRYHIEGVKNFKRERRVVREIGKFFAAYALEQDICQVLSDKVIHEFVDPKTKAVRKKELGNFIMMHALDMSLEPLKPVFKSLRAEGVTPINKQPNLVHIVRRFIKRRHMPDYYEEIVDKMLGIA